MSITAMSSPGENLDVMTPREARQMFRNGTDNHFPSTSGMCMKHLQANLAMIKKQNADDFRQYCRQNAAPCPLLYCSEPGEYAAPPLAQDSDVRADVQRYRVYKDGKMTVVPSLAEYAWEDIVTFYLGCSFGLENLLLAQNVPVRHIQQGSNVPMFKTSVRTKPAGPFHGPLVVSMRPVPEEKLADAVNASRLSPLSHGIPVHIGDPAWIGIDHSTTSDGTAVLTNVVVSQFGDGRVQCHADDVQVFWACGVTSSVATANAGMELCFTHDPGSMFICDKLSVPDTTIDTSHPVEVIKFTAARLPAVYSILAQDVLKRIQCLEELILRDPGQRGAHHLLVEGDLLRSALSLSSRHRRVVVATGFPCVPEPPHEETDGLPGAIALIRAVQALGADDVVLLCDVDVESLYREVAEFSYAKGILSKPVHLQVVHMTDSEQDIVAEVATFDHLIAIERVSPNVQGLYYSMTGRDLSTHCSPIDRWFSAALCSSTTMTTGIGDGGNEVGMAKVHDQVVAHVPLGEEIVSSVRTDYLISSGVSNWGGYALAASLYALQACTVHSYYTRYGLGEHQAPDHHQFLPDVEMERKLLAKLNELQVLDGTRPEQAMSVDGFLFDDLHAGVIESIVDAVTV
ncbi:D-glutamate cyclase, mitochondrial-like [Sycon ciliatum]|uniref:D-glutamate cyclase, mitochondrial-like n=1 Tax=Sycon ciliatum TaxID=27933 RepID=UPI0031F65D0E